jgi:phosphatidylinositol alpha-mannosyltransferase
VATSHAKIPDGLTNKALVNMFSSYTKSLIKCIDAYSAVSEPAAEYIKGFVDDKIEIIPNGINLSRYQPTAKKPSKYKTILYIGRLEKRKGVIYLLEAFKEVAKHHPEARLRIAGDGELRTKFEQWVKEHRVPRVEFLGFVSENRKHKLLNEADLFCSPALYGESFGIVLLEAMAMGLVTVAGDNPGYASVMRSKGKVSLVDPRNTHAFAKKLEMFLYDEKERDDWKKWALEYVKQFDYPKIVDKYERLYKHGLKNAKR